MVSISVQGEIIEVNVNEFITINDVIDMLTKHLDSLEYTQNNHRILLNAIRCRTNINLRDLSELDSINKEINERFNDLKIAVVIDDPIYTAICMVYQQLIKPFHYHFQVFSTKSAARRWLHKDMLYER
ncbi:hypothetical protein E9993_10060 [Labilibacter sediminis]|nr:hypothetical protein E9993_10060 [Labilibacter sediminis]